MEYFLGLVINGIVVGSIYSLVALGLVLIYKATEVLLPTENKIKNTMVRAKTFSINLIVFLAFISGLLDTTA